MNSMIDAAVAPIPDGQPSQTNTSWRLRTLYDANAPITSASTNRGCRCRHRSNEGPCVDGSVRGGGVQVERSRDWGSLVASVPGECIVTGSLHMWTCRLVTDCAGPGAGLHVVLGWVGQGGSRVCDASECAMQEVPAPPDVSDKLKEGKGEANLSVLRGLSGVEPREGHT